MKLFSKIFLAAFGLILMACPQPTDTLNQRSTGLRLALKTTASTDSSRSVSSTYYDTTKTTDEDGNETFNNDLVDLENLSFHMLYMAGPGSAMAFNYQSDAIVDATDITFDTFNESGYNIGTNELKFSKSPNDTQVLYSKNSIAGKYINAIRINIPSFIGGWDSEAFPMGSAYNYVFSTTSENTTKYYNADISENQSLEIESIYDSYLYRAYESKDLPKTRMQNHLQMIVLVPAELFPRDGKSLYIGDLTRNLSLEEYNGENSWDFNRAEVGPNGEEEWSNFEEWYDSKRTKDPNDCFYKLINTELLAKSENDADKVKKFMKFAWTMVSGKWDYHTNPLFKGVKDTTLDLSHTIFIKMDPLDATKLVDESEDTALVVNLKLNLLGSNYEKIESENIGDYIEDLLYEKGFESEYIAKCKNNANRGIISFMKSTLPDFSTKVDSLPKLVEITNEETEISVE